MPEVQHIKEKNAVLVPIEDWEKVQKELIRLRKRVKKAEILEDIRAAILSMKKNEKKGVDAREFVNELLNAQ
jgi:hypothetical protein